MWIDQPLYGLLCMSASGSLPNGGLPIAMSKKPPGTSKSSKPWLRTLAEGYSPAAMRLVIGSSSTPNSCAVARIDLGIRPKKLPDPTEGSSTRPRVAPSRSSTEYMALTTTGLV